MTDKTGVEAWAALNIEAALPGVAVHVNDDGSMNAMHDLDFYREGRVFGACEVTAAADEAAIEFWNIANGPRSDGWTEPGLVGSWLIRARPGARINRLRQELPAILRALEQNGIDEVRAEWGPRHFSSRLHDLGVDEVYQFRTDNPGSICLTLDELPDGRGGIVTDHGDDLARWVGDWLADPDQQHNIEKVLRAGREETHLFIVLPGFTAAPFAAVDVLVRSGGPLPAIPPRLPLGIDHLWLMSTWDTGDLFEWDGRNWLRHHKVLATDSGRNDSGH